MLIAIVVGIYLILHHGLATAHVKKHLAGGAGTTTGHVVGPGSTGSSTGRRHPTPRYYVVRPGDSLDVIALRTGVALRAIEALNPGVSPNRLRPGQRLKLRR